jgi:hypothetical protein
VSRHALLAQGVAIWNPGFLVKLVVGLTPLLNGVAEFTLLAASIAQPLFHGGEFKAQKRSAVVALDPRARSAPG